MILKEKQSRCSDVCSLCWSNTEGANRWPMMKTTRFQPGKENGYRKMRGCKTKNHFRSSAGRKMNLSTENKEPEAKKKINKEKRVRHDDDALFGSRAPSG